MSIKTKQTMNYYYICLLKFNSVIYFLRCIRGMLKSKVCILVTHQLQFLDEADRILCLQKVCPAMQRFSLFPKMLLRHEKMNATVFVSFKS